MQYNPFAEALNCLICEAPCRNAICVLCDATVNGRNTLQDQDRAIIVHGTVVAEIEARLQRARDHMVMLEDVRNNHKRVVESREDATRARRKRNTSGEEAEWLTSRRGVPMASMGSSSSSSSSSEVVVVLNLCDTSSEHEDEEAEEDEETSACTGGCGRLLGSQDSNGEGQCGFCEAEEQRSRKHRKRVPRAVTLTECMTCTEEKPDAENRCSSVACSYESCMTCWMKWMQENGTCPACRAEA